MTKQILYRKIKDHFNEEEIRQLCFDLHLNYEDLRGDQRLSKLQALISYCDRHGTLNELINLCRQSRPNISWDNISNQTDLSKTSVTWGAIVVVFFVLGALIYVFSERDGNKEPVQTIPPADATDSIVMSSPLTETPMPSPTMTHLPASVINNDPTEVSPLSTIDTTIVENSITFPTIAYTPTTETENGYTYVLIPAKRSPEQTIEIEEYWIGVYEITNLWFAIYLSNTDSGNSCSNGSLCIDTQLPNVRISRKDGQWIIDEGYENHPVTGVTWYGANDYCNAIGGRLPEYAEWIHAASWNPITNKSMPYPWGEQPPSPNLANYNNHTNDTQAVTSLPEGRTIFGTYNMLGNVWEFVANTQGINRTAVGGGWDTPQNQLIIGVSYPATEHTTSPSLGFRCAR